MSTIAIEWTDGRLNKVRCHAEGTDKAVVRWLGKTYSVSIDPKDYQTGPEVTLFLTPEQLDSIVTQGVQQQQERDLAGDGVADAMRREEAIAAITVDKKVR